MDMRMYIGKLEELIELWKVAYRILRVQLKLKLYLEFNPEKKTDSDSKE